MIRLFRVYVPVGTLALLISEIILLAAAFGVATYTTLVGDPEIFLYYEGGWIRISIVIVSILIGLYFHDLYTDLFVKAKLALLQQLCLIIGGAFLLQGFISYLDVNLRVPIRVMVAGKFPVCHRDFLLADIFHQVCPSRGQSRRPPSGGGQPAA